MSLSNEIRMIRQRQLMSQIEFAKILNVSYTTVNRWETGKARPSISKMRELKKLCEKLNADYSKIEETWLLAENENVD